MFLAASLLEPALRIIQQSGEIIKANWARQHTVRYKGRIDLVTETDLAVEDFLKKHLSALLPDATFMAEESSVPGQDPGKLCWIIDPVDGTTNFVHRIPQVGTSVALWHEDHIVLAMVNVPMMDECYWAVRGKGAFRNGQAIHVSRAAQLSETLVATGFPYDAGERISLIMRRLAAVLPGSQGMRRIGAASVDLAYLACGKVDAFYEDWLKPWDVAAGWLIVEEAGGKVSNFKNETYTFHEPLLATNGLVHETMSRLLQIADDFTQPVIC